MMMSFIGLNAIEVKVGRVVVFFWSVGKYISDLCIRHLWGLSYSLSFFLSLSRNINNIFNPFQSCLWSENIFVFVSISLSLSVMQNKWIFSSLSFLYFILFLSLSLSLCFFFALRYKTFASSFSNLTSLSISLCIFYLSLCMLFLSNKLSLSLSLSLLLVTSLSYSLSLSHISTLFCLFPIKLHASLSFLSNIFSPY